LTHPARLGVENIIEHAYPASLDELLPRFVAPSSDRLEVFLERRHEAEAARYPRLA